MTWKRLGGPWAPTEKALESWTWAVVTRFQNATVTGPPVGQENVGTSTPAPAVVNCMLVGLANETVGTVVEVVAPLTYVPLWPPPEESAAVVGVAPSSPFQ